MDEQISNACSIAYYDRRILEYIGIPTCDYNISLVHVFV